MSGLDHAHYMALAFAQARKSYDEGGCPIGAVLVDTPTGKILGQGHNRLIQDNDPTVHGETDAVKNAGALSADQYRRATLYTTLSPCIMCAGLIVAKKFNHIVIGDNQNFEESENWLRTNDFHNPQMTVLNVPEMIEYFANFIRERPDQWFTDIARPVPAAKECGCC